MRKRILTFSFLLISVSLSAQWFYSPSPHGRDINCVKIFSPDTILTAGGWQIRNSFQTALTQSIFKSFNRGLDWNVNEDIDGGWIKSVEFMDSQNGIAVGADTVIIRTYDGGETWSPVHSPVGRNFNKIYFIDSLNIIIVGGIPLDSFQSNRTQTILRSSDGGQSWNVVLDQAGFWLKAVFFPTPSLGYAVGDSGTILKSTNAGNTWIPVSSPIRRDFNSIWFTDANHGFIAGGNLANDSMRTILQTTNGGNTWTVLKDELGGWLTDIYFLDKDTGYIVGDRATVLKTTDAGQTWVQQTIPGATGNESFNTVRFYNTEFGIVAGKWGEEYIYNHDPAPEAFTTGADVIDSVNVVLKGYVNSKDIPALYTFVFASNDSFINSLQLYPAPIHSNHPVLVLGNAPPLTPNTTYYFFIEAWTLGGTVYGDTLSFFTGTPATQINTLAASNITDTTATLNGKLKGFPAPVNVMFEYGPTLSFGNILAANPATINDTLEHIASLNISSLQPATQYYFRIKAVSGTSSYYGNTLSFYTGIGKLFTTLKTLPATGIMDSSAILNGLADGFKVPATLSFDYSANNTSFNNSIPLVNINDSLQHPVSMQVTSLMSATRYYFRLKAETQAGSVYGDTLQFYSYYYAGDLHIKTLPATDVTHSAAQLNGSAGNIDVPAILSFEYGITPALGSTVQANPGSINDTSTYEINAMVNGLLNNSIYYYRLKVEIMTGGEFYGEIRQLYTGDPEIPNWDFQYWKIDTLVLPDKWNIINDHYERVPGHSGNNALKISDQSIAILGNFYEDQSAGGPLFLNGVPFHSRPDSITVYLNYSLAPGDTGVIGIHLYDEVNNDICFNLFRISGNTGQSFERHSFALTYNSGLTPDTMVLALIPYNPFVEQPFNSADYIIVDDFETVPFAPIYNSDMETWTVYDINALSGWNYRKHPFINVSSDELVNQTFFASPADYAVEIQNIDLGNGYLEGGEINNDRSLFGSKKSGGFPVSERYSSLNGYYKWFPVNADTMLIDIQMLLYGQAIGNGRLVQTDSVPQFTRFDIPIIYDANNIVPDSATILLRAYSFEPLGSSVLVVDKLSFDGFWSLTGINSIERPALGKISIFPNPAHSFINIQLAEDIKGKLEIFNLSGKIVHTGILAANRININVERFPKGMYLVKITQGSNSVTGKFMVIR